MGEIVFDEMMEEYRTKIKINGWYIDLNFVTEDIDELKSMVKKYKLCFSKLEDFDKKAKTYASTTLLKLKNEHWLEDEDDAKPITEEDFINSIYLTGITIYDDSYELCYNDGNLFYGHIIIVSGDFEKGFDSASIAG